MADKNFKGGPGGRLKAAAANFIKPTTQDSLDLYNQALVINKFYGSNPDYKKEGEVPFGKYLKNTQQNYEDLLSEPSSKWGLSLLTGPSSVKTLNQEFGTKETQKSLQNKFKNKGVFQAYPNLLGGHYDIYANPRVPPIYLHPSIKPNSVTTYESGNFMDVADVPKYDPIAVKPVSMLTPQERIEREKKYGSISPKPKPKPVPVITRTVSEEVEPIAPRQAVLPSIAPSEIVAPVMRPVSVPESTPMEEPVMEEEVITERPVARKPPRAVMPRRAGGWGNQPLLMQLFPKLYQR